VHITTRILHAARLHDVPFLDGQKQKREPVMKKTVKCKTGKWEKSTTNILTNQMWGKGSASRQDNDVNIGELIILI
jgi:hypothetical protein